MLSHKFCPSDGFGTLCKPEVRVHHSTKTLRGWVIVVQRKRRRPALRREKLKHTRVGSRMRKYKKLLRVRDADEIDLWAWEWRGLGRSLASRRRQD